MGIETEKVRPLLQVQTSLSIDCATLQLGAGYGIYRREEIDALVHDLVRLAALLAEVAEMPGSVPLPTWCKVARRAAEDALDKATRHVR